MAKRPFYITLDPSQLTSSPHSDPVLALRALPLLQNFHALRPTHCPLACVNFELGESRVARLPAEVASRLPEGCQ
eukprot:2677158-Prymnesium_polylepis.1